MSLIYERIVTPGIAQLSYLIGDTKTKEAAVVDPRPDCQFYLETARSFGLSIRYIIETHNHADFLSGARHLAQACGSGTSIYVSEEGGTRYEFEHEQLSPDQKIKIGNSVLRAMHTPGHTPEHMSIILEKESAKNSPLAVMSGDSLFSESAGRPDLLGENAENLARKLYDTLYDFYLQLPEGTIVNPGHGRGSACGADIGERMETTIGYEKKKNPMLQFAGRKEEFVEYAISSAPPEPTHYRRLKRMNAEQIPTSANLPPVQALSPHSFQDCIKNGDNQMIDVRTNFAFGSGHIAGALNIGGSPKLSVWAGWMLNASQPIYVILNDDRELPDITARFLRTGFMNVAGYLSGGMKAWAEAGMEIEEMPQISVHQLKRKQESLQIIDVRSPEEWKEGHIPGAKHCFVPEIRRRLGDFAQDKPTAVYCHSGYRANIAASILKQEGFKEVYGVPGSYRGWTSAGYKVEK